MTYSCPILWFILRKQKREIPGKEGTGMNYEIVTLQKKESPASLYVRATPARTCSRRSANFGRVIFGRSMEDWRGARDKLPTAYIPITKMAHKAIMMLSSAVKWMVTRRHRRESGM